MTEERILVIGAAGQIGSELVLALREKHGADRVIAADIREASTKVMEGGAFVKLDVLKKDDFLEVVKKYDIKVVYQLAALLSATAEQNPDFAWKLNMEGLFNVLDLAKDKHIKRVFWPSSIAVFGPTTPKQNTPQQTITEPNTVYGISKLAGERWCEYYFKKFGVDVRSLRYPGLISYSSPPGGGTTDYAIDIFHQAKKEGKYECFLQAGQKLPMMYMDDAIRATIQITEAPAEDIKVRSSYNLSGLSFSPDELSNAIKKELSDFEIFYNPDFRQQIAEGWPESIDDECAVSDWGWKNKTDLCELVKIMLKNI